MVNFEVSAGFKRPGLAQARQTGYPRRFVVGFGLIVLGAPAGVGFETPSAPHTSPSAPNPQKVRHSRI
jgi:hypothetical protein